MSDTKIDCQLVRQCISSCVEGMVEGIAKEIGDRGGVDVGQPNEPPGEVTRSTPRPEHAAKSRVENGLHAYPAHVHRRRWSGGSSTSGYTNSSTACNSRNNTQVC